MQVIAQKTRIEDLNTGEVFCPINLHRSWYMLTDAPSSSCDRGAVDLYTGKYATFAKDEPVKVARKAVLNIQD